MSHALFEQFLNTGTMMAAEQELLTLGTEAVPILESLFNGESKNSFGVPYRQLGLPLRCAMEVAARLQSIAKPLEPYLRERLQEGDPVAATALGHLGSLEDASVVALVVGLQGNPILAYESAGALIKCHQASHPDVIRAISSSASAATALEHVDKLIARRQGTPV